LKFIVENVVRDVLKNYDEARFAPPSEGEARAGFSLYESAKARGGRVKRAEGADTGSSEPEVKPTPVKGNKGDENPEDFKDYT
jgi:hypothetical protein